MAEQRDMFEQEPADDANVKARVIAAVGQDGLRKLVNAGLTILDVAELKEFETGMNDNAERARELARASMRAADLRSMTIEFSVPTCPPGTSGMRIIVCDPSGNEDATLRKVIKMMGAEPDDGPKLTPKRARRVRGKGA